jgi:hypothetical protein
METKFKKVATQLHEDLITLNDNPPLERYNAAIAIIDIAIAELKELVLGHTFESQQEEIDYFKNTRPLVLSYRIEEGLKYNLAVNVPIGTAENLIHYYEDGIKGLQSFFRLNEFFYQYYKNHLSELDDLYFTRKSGPLKIPTPEVINADLASSTPMSDIFAKFIAHENVQHYILGQIALQNYPDLHLSNSSGATASEMRWTGDSINIVELAYGLWLTGQINNGNASLNQIVRWLEANFQVNIGIVQRRFSEISRRKRLSPTKYIDQMKDNIMQKIDADNT